ncbi:MAG: glutamine-hydrolyzing GMP synthase [bacterium]
MDRVLILDFGSQYNQLIARRVREQKVYSEIVPHDITPAAVRARGASALILSGGPASARAPGAPLPDQSIFALGIPVLGICYGMQVIALLAGGRLEGGTKREYGDAALESRGRSPLLAGVPARSRVWMSHGDHVARMPRGFVSLGRTDSIRHAAIGDEKRHIYGVQFHPEVAHTDEGGRILANFLFRVADCRADWTMRSFIHDQVEETRRRVGDGKVICAVSGGVDSSVMAALLRRAIGTRLISVFVDNGLLRKGEAEEVRRALGRRLALNVVDARDEFLSRLRGVADPEEKRRRIGRTFIKVFERAALAHGPVRFLAQGTLYPDLVESRSAFGGPSATIKTHHNVGGLPRRMKLELIEPLRELFKDEVRALGRELGLPDALINRHPFPGPGLAVRILGPVTPERVSLLQQADHIFIAELRDAGLYDQVWQALAVLLPTRTVGVMGDERTYENAVVLRAVTSTDAMTADWARLPDEFLARVSNRIIREVRGINRVVYDISSKPPATIEWE